MYGITILKLSIYLIPAEVSIYSKDKHNETSKGFRIKMGDKMIP